jgi:hypothetical protein
LADELVQIDGSDHTWFEDRAPACTLLVHVDDSTSRVMALHFTASESTFSYFEATRTYIGQRGGEIAHDARHWPPTRGHTTGSGCVRAEEGLAAPSAQ